MKRWEGARGVTLIEIILAVFILAAALMPTFDLLARGSAQVRVSREEIIATLSASELLDQILCMPFGDLTDTTDMEIPASFTGNLVQAKPSTILILSPKPVDFRLRLSIKSSSDYLKKVTVTISWNLETPHEVRLASFMEYAP